MAGDSHPPRAASHCGVVKWWNVTTGSIPRSAKSASAVFNLPFLGLMFISGVFIESNSIPDWVRTVAGVSS